MNESFIRKVTCLVVEDVQVGDAVGPFHPRSWHRLVEILNPLPFEFKTFLIEPEGAIACLERILHGRVTFERRMIGDLHDLLSESQFDFVVNCAGMGAAALASDSTLFPSRGMLLRIERDTFEIIVG